MIVLVVLAGSYVFQFIYILYWLNKLMEVLLVEFNINVLYYVNLDVIEYII